jgi:hypothetical protein
MRRLHCSVLTSLATLALGACAHASAPTTEQRVLVQLVQPEGDAARVAERVARSSGAPARYLAASGGGWHALALACADAAACDTALERLRSDSGVLAVQPDARKRIVTP